MMDDRTRKLLHEPPLGLLVSMATPNSIAFLIQAGVSLTEVWLIGKLGLTPLAAIALVFPLLMLNQALSGGALGGAVASSISRAMGAGDVDRAERLIWHALATAAVGALVLLVIFLLIGEPFLVFLGGKGESLEEAVAYCLVLFPGAILIWLMGVLGAIFRGTGEMLFPAKMMILSACIQVPLSAILILGAFGVESIGIVGAAVSAVVASGTVSGLLAWNMAKGRLPIRPRRVRLKFERALFNDILGVALPASLSPLLTVTNILILTAIVARFGETALAGYGIGSRIEFLLIPLIFGLGAAMTALVGLSVGAGDIARAEHIGRIGGVLAMCVAGAIGVGLALSAEVWIPLFSSDPETMDAARLYIYFLGPCFAFNGLGLSLYFACQGAGAMFWPIFATVIRIVVAAVGALLLTRVMGFGLSGVYSAAALAMVLYGVIIAAAVRMGAWRPASPK
jgi:putative MATE family efflux protein